jgi:hypothetical protein
MRRPLQVAHWLIPLLVAAPVGAQVGGSVCDFGSVHPDSPPEARQFDFLVGEHDVTLHAWTGAGWTPPRSVNARWNGRYALEGRAIYDEWIDPDTTSATGPVHGVNVRVYDPDERSWTMMWIATPARQVQDLRAEMRDGVLTMWQVHPERPGWKAEFEVLDGERWARVSYTRQDATGDWVPQFRLVATRRPCEA